MAWEDPHGTPRGAALREVARIAAVVAAALAAGAGLLLLITQVAAPAQPRASVAGQGAASPTPAPSAASLPTLPPVAVPAPPPTAADGPAPDRYLGDLTFARGTSSGEIDGTDYRFAHGFGMSLSANTRVDFVVPAGYRSLTASLKSVGATIRFTLTLGGQTLIDRTLSPFQPPLTLTCATPPGGTIVLSALFEGGGALADAVALWGDARFSPSPAPAAGCA